MPAYCPTSDENRPSQLLSGHRVRWPESSDSELKRTMSGSGSPLPARQPVGLDLLASALERPETRRS
jgi:hypothetical protein